MILPGETEAGTAGTQPCRGITRRAHRTDISSAGGSSPALHADRKKSSDDRPSCLENPRPAGEALLESTVPMNAWHSHSEIQT